MARMMRLDKAEPGQVVQFVATVVRQSGELTFLRFPGGVRWYVRNAILVEGTGRRIEDARFR